MALKLRIVTPARLHFGIIDMCGDLGRMYGSIGVAINRPNVILEATPSESLKVSGLRRNRTLQIAKDFLKKFPHGNHAHINILNSIPEHAGLGSGTQLSLAIGMAITKLSKLDLSVREVALALERGGISAVGVNIFEHGGFILDCGRRLTEARLSLALFRTKFPEEWRFVVAIPKVKSGLSGSLEKRAIANLPPSSPELVGRICRILIMKMLPAIIEKNIDDFGEALTSIQYLVGDSFSDAQGGRFCSPLIEECVRFMISHGANGAGQSSWGPTVYAIVKNQREAEVLKNTVKNFLNTKSGGTIFIAKANNNGANLKIE